MNLFATACVRFFRRIHYRWRRVELDRELAEEIAHHVALKSEDSSTDDIVGKEMGNITLAKEECRDMWSFLSLERMLHDLHYALRTFRKSPVFTAVAVISIALGLGGNTAMFSLVNSLLVKPLPFASPSQLVRLTGTYPRAAVRWFRERSRTMEIAAVSSGETWNFALPERASQEIGSNTSVNLFGVLGIAPALGRNFHADEDLPGRERVAILSNALWKSRFQGDPNVIGRIVRVNGVDREVIGIMPPTFAYPSATVQIWVPMRLDPGNFLEYWAGEFVPLIGRLRTSATIPAAQGEVRTLLSAFRRTFPYPMARDWNADVAVIPLQRDIVGNIRGKLIILLASVGVVLLIACTNVASLLLARATTRRKELAVRAALGAGRARIVRQLLTESAALALVAAVTGIGLGIAALSVFKAVLPASTPGLAQTAVDWTVVAAITIVALFAGIASGISPALGASQVDLTDTIKTGSQRSTGRAWVRLRSVLVATEIALTVILMVSAGLLLKSLYKLSKVDPGFDPAHVVAIRVSPEQATCNKRSACVAFYDRLIQQADGLGQVSDAAVVNSVPLSGELPQIPVDLEDHPKTAEHPAPMLWLGAVSPNYFSAMRLQLVAGRLFAASDAENAAKVVVISADTARSFWPHQTAIGKHLRLSGEPQWRTIVGIVRDVKQYSLATGLPKGVAGAVYMPYAQAVREDGQIPAAMTLLVKLRSDDALTVRQLERLAQEQGPNVPIQPAERLQNVEIDSIANFRAIMRLFLSFAGTAMLLAGIGIYGLMSYWVSQRAYEIGLRLAIGATPGSIVFMIFGQGLRLALYGVVFGAAAALIVTRALASLLYGVGTTDAITFLCVVVLTLLVAAIATAFPAWRAIGVDPARTLRPE